MINDSTTTKTEQAANCQELVNNSPAVVLSADHGGVKSPKTWSAAVRGPDSPKAVWKKKEAKVTPMAQLMDETMPEADLVPNPNKKGGLVAPSLHGLPDQVRQVFEIQFQQAAVTGDVQKFNDAVAAVNSIHKANKAQKELKKQSKERRTGRRDGRGSKHNALIGADVARERSKQAGTRDSLKDKLEEANEKLRQLSAEKQTEADDAAKAEAAKQDAATRAAQSKIKTHKTSFLIPFGERPDGYRILAYIYFIIAFIICNCIFDQIVKYYKYRVLSLLFLFEIIVSVPSICFITVALFKTGFFLMDNLLRITRIVPKDEGKDGKEAVAVDIEDINFDAKDDQYVDLRVDANAFQDILHKDPLLTRYRVSWKTYDLVRDWPLPLWNLLFFCSIVQPTLYNKRSDDYRKQGDYLIVSTELLAQLLGPQHMFLLSKYEDYVRRATLVASRYSKMNTNKYGEVAQDNVFANTTFLASLYFASMKMRFMHLKALINPAEEALPANLAKCIDW